MLRHALSSTRVYERDQEQHGARERETCWTLRESAPLRHARLAKASSNGTSARLTGQSHTPFRESRKTQGGRCVGVFTRVRGFNRVGFFSPFGSCQPPATTCRRGVIVPFNTRHPPRCVERRRGATGNLTSLSPPFSVPSFPTTGGSRARVIGVSHFVCRDVCFVCSLPIFRVPLPGEFPVYVEVRLPSFLTCPYPFSVHTHTPFSHTHTHPYADLTVPSRPILAAAADIPCVVSARVRKRSSESRGLFRGGFPFSHLWVSPLPSTELLPPTPVGDTTSWWSGVRSWATSTTILPAPGSLLSGEGGEVGDPSPPPPPTSHPTYRHMVKRSEVKTSTRGDGKTTTSSSLNFATFAERPFSLPRTGNSPVLGAEREERGWRLAYTHRSTYSHNSFRVNRKVWCVVSRSTLILMYLLWYMVTARRAENYVWEGEVEGFCLRIEHVVPVRLRSPRDPVHSVIKRWHRLFWN